MSRSFAFCFSILLSVPAVQANSPEPYASFGGAIAFQEDQLFIGEPTGFKNPGTVHVYVRGENLEWQLQHSLVSPDAYVGDEFGSAIAYGDGILAVTGQSIVYIFERQEDTGEFIYSDRIELESSTTFANSIALEEGWLAVSGSLADADLLQVFLFHKSLDGTWNRKAILDAPDANEGSIFGTALAMDRDRLLVGDPGACAAYLYEYEADTWEMATTLPCGELANGSAYAATLDLNGQRAAIGAPRHSRGVGAVIVWDLTDIQEAKPTVLIPETPASPQFFGAQIQILNSRWVAISAPFAEEMEGRVHIYSFQDSGTVNPKGIPVRGTGPRFGSTLATDGSIIAVGIPGDAYGEGSAELVEFKDGTWGITQQLFNTGEEVIALKQITCEGNQAAAYDCGLVDLVSFLPNQEMEMNRGVRLSDVWGWTDPETGIEYGLIGHLEGTVFLDLSNPSSPKYLGTLPRTEGSPGSTWRDIKVYNDHAFIVADRAREHGMQIFDLTQLRELAAPSVEFEATAQYDLFHSAHNIVINEETGFAFVVGASGGGETCGGGLHMIDIREPQAPAFAGCFADETTGRSSTGYSHDAQCVIYNGPDTEFVGREVCFGANETAISISDVTDKSTPIALGTGSYPDAAYVHQGWLSEDHTYFYQNDELDELTGKVDKTRTLVWDVRDLSDPILIREFYGPTSATDHNLYVQGDLMYQTNNASGLRIIDISTPEDPVEIGFFDTTPYGTDEAGFNGTWSSYPYFESGIIVVTSRREGVFILKKQSIDI